MTRAGIEPTAAAPSQPTRLDVSRSDHSTASNNRFGHSFWNIPVFKKSCQWREILPMTIRRKRINAKNYWKLIPKTIGNRKKRLCVRLRWGINITWENLQIEKHKSVWWAEWTPSWFVLCDLQIFSGGVYPPSATSRTTSFFYFQ